MARAGERPNIVHGAMLVGPTEPAQATTPSPVVAPSSTTLPDTLPLRRVKDLTSSHVRSEKRAQATCLTFPASSGSSAKRLTGGTLKLGELCWRHQFVKARMTPFLCEWARLSGWAQLSWGSQARLDCITTCALVQTGHAVVQQARLAALRSLILR
jgi:hypothetical protein